MITIKNLNKILKLHNKLTYENDIAKIRKFLNDFDYNEKHENELTLDSSSARKACDNLQKTLSQCLNFVGETIPPIKILDEDFIYSVRGTEKPPFIARTNDPAVIEKIYQLFIRMGGWQEVKFLFENLRLNDDFGA